MRVERSEAMKRLYRQHWYKHEYDFQSQYTVHPVQRSSFLAPQLWEPCVPESLLAPRKGWGRYSKGGAPGVHLSSIQGRVEG